MKKRLVLASASPRRREILENAGYEFEIFVSECEEIKGGMSARELAVENALSKARAVLEALPERENTYVLGADTVVCKGEAVLGKPKDEADAMKMLSLLSGARHSVITGYAVVGENVVKSGFCETEVAFNALSKREAEAYVSTGEPFDKAGAYGIQDRGSLFVSGINGDYFNVMGLPAEKIYTCLSELGIFPKWLEA